MTSYNVFSMPTDSKQKPIGTVLFLSNGTPALRLPYEAAKALMDAIKEIHTVAPPEGVPHPIDYGSAEDLLLLADRLRITGYELRLRKKP